MQRCDSVLSKFPEKNVLSDVLLYSAEFPENKTFLAKKKKKKKKNQELKNPTSDYVSNLAAKVLKIPNIMNDTQSVWGRASICKAYFNRPFYIILINYLFI